MSSIFCKSKNLIARRLYDTVDSDTNHTCESLKLNPLSVDNVVDVITDDLLTYIENKE